MNLPDLMVAVGLAHPCPRNSDDLFLIQPAEARQTQGHPPLGLGLGLHERVGQGIALEEVQSRVYKPFRAADLPSSRRFRQALWTDAVYVRQLFDLDRLDADDLIRLFVILHVAYGATDLCTRVLERLDARTGNATAGHYRAQALASLRPTDAAGTA